MAMKNQLWKIAAAASLGALLLSGCAGGTTTTNTPGQNSSTSQSSAGPAGTGSASPATSATLTTGSSTLGTIVVNGQGLTAYVFDHDSAGSGKSSCAGACIALWPAITSTTATPTVSGVSGSVATIALPDGKMQITLNGFPLYTYAADSAPGDVRGQGYGSIWWAVAPDGTKVTGSPATTSGGSGY